MVRPDKVEGKLENLRGYVQKLTHLASLPRKEFLSDFTKDIEAKLGDQGVGDSELGQGKDGSGELAQAYDSYPESGDIDDSHPELPDGDDSLRRNRHPVGPVFQGNVKQREPEKTGLGFVFESPPSPFSLYGRWSPAVRADESPLADHLLKFPTWFHDGPSCLGDSRAPDFSTTSPGRSSA